MIFQFYFKRIQSSEFLKDLAQRKFADATERFLDSSGLIHVTFSHEKNQKLVHCHLHSRNGTLLHASGGDETIYAAIDNAAQKLESQLSRHKLKGHRRWRLAAREMRQQLDGEVTEDSLDLTEIRAFKRSRA